MASEKHSEFEARLESEYGLTAPANTSPRPFVSKCIVVQDNYLEGDSVNKVILFFTVKFP